MVLLTNVAVARADRQRAVVEDAAAVAVPRGDRRDRRIAGAIADRQAAQGYRGVRGHFEYPRVVMATVQVGAVAADGQLAGARTLDRQVLGEVQFAAGERDGLSIQTGGEDDSVAAVGGGDFGP